MNVFQRCKFVRITSEILHDPREIGFCMIGPRKVRKLVAFMGDFSLVQAYSKYQISPMPPIQSQLEVVPANVCKLSPP